MRNEFGDKKWSILSKIKENSAKFVFITIRQLFAVKNGIRL